MAARSLGLIGPAAGAAAPRLRQALRDENDEVRLAAQAALQAIEGK